MITRRKNYTKQAPTRDARKLYIFCEGVGTEPSYFSFFEGLSTNLEIITVPPESGTDPLKLLELAGKLKLQEQHYLMAAMWKPYMKDLDTMFTDALRTSTPCGILWTGK